MGTSRKSYSILVEGPGWKNLLGKPWRKYRSNQSGNIDLREIGGGKWVRLVRLRIWYRGSLLFIR